MIDFKNTYDYKNKIFKNNFPNNDKEMIGLYYPKIIFDKLKEGLKNLNIISLLLNSLIKWKLINISRKRN